MTSSTRPVTDFRTLVGRIWVRGGNECSRRLFPTTVTTVREYGAKGIAARLDGPGPLHSQ
ncbi:hypothetical protein [Streptomyces sp. NPDC002530]